jgi:hypothetical protein
LSVFAEESPSVVSGRHFFSGVMIFMREAGCKERGGTVQKFAAGARIAGRGAPVRVKRTGGTPALRMAIALVASATGQHKWHAQIGTDPDGGIEQIASDAW